MKIKTAIKKIFGYMGKKISKIGVWAKSKKRNKVILVASLCLIIIVGAVVVGGFVLGKPEAVSVNIDVQVTKGDIEVKIEGSGTVEPVESYNIMPLVRGTILQCNYEEGDKVKEGDVLYVIDYSDAEASIEKTHNSLEKLQKTEKELRKKINNLTYYAESSGILSGFNLKKGQSVSDNGSQIGEVIDTSKLKVVAPFNSSQIANIYVGQSATVTFSKYMQSVTGTVIKKSNARNSSTFLYDVTVEIDVDSQKISSIGEGVSATVAIDGETSAQSGKTVYPDSVLLVTEAGGKVKNVYASNGDWVNKGDKIVEFENDSVETQLENNLLDQKDLMSTLKTQGKDLDDYTITSPISGSVITKNYKKGDNLQQSTESTLMVVADMSQMIFNIDADELDIKSIQIGQPVDVKADALPEQVFDAEVTAISTTGTSVNGVTTYSVEVTIFNPEGLLPGMNVTGSIIIDTAEDVVRVPVAAVNAKNGRYFVYVKNAAEGEIISVSENDKELSGRIISQLIKNAPEGTTLAEVKVGISNEDYIEITEGLSENMTIVMVGTSEDIFSTMQAVAGMHGMGTMGGRMPSGSGMPQGGPAR